MNLDPVGNKLYLAGWASLKAQWQGNNWGSPYAIAVADIDDFIESMKINTEITDVPTTSTTRAPLPSKSHKYLSSINKHITNPIDMSVNRKFIHTKLGENIERKYKHYSKLQYNYIQKHKLLQNSNFLHKNKNKCYRNKCTEQNIKINSLFNNTRYVNKKQVSLYLLLFNISF